MITRFLRIHAAVDINLHMLRHRNRQDQPVRTKSRLWEALGKDACASEVSGSAQAPSAVYNSLSERVSRVLVVVMLPLMPDPGHKQPPIKHLCRRVPDKLDVQTMEQPHNQCPCALCQRAICAVILTSSSLLSFLFLFSIRTFLD